VKIAEAAHYTNAGTVEFIVDNSRQFLFPRSQQTGSSRASVTEEVTGIDLVRYQILLAMGEPLQHSQGDIQNQRATPLNAALTPKTRSTISVPAPDGLEMYFQPGGRGVARRHPCLRGLHDPINVRLNDWQAYHHGQDRREAMDRMNARSRNT